MAKKKNTPKKKKLTKKEQEQRSRLLHFLVGLLFILLGVFGILKLGFLGILMANVLRFIGGNTFIFLATILILYGLYLVFTGAEIEIKRKKLFFGALICYFAVLMLAHAFLFKGIVNSDSQIISLTWQILYTDVRTNTIAANVGGGMLGALFYSGIYFLVEQIGVYIVAALMLLIGVLMISNLHWFQIVEVLKHGFGNLGEGAVEKKEARKVQRAERAAEKAEAKRLAKIEAEAQRIEAEKMRVEEEELIAAQAAEAAAALEKNAVRYFSPGEELAREEASEIQQEVANEPEQLSFMGIESYQQNNEYSFESDAPIKLTPAQAAVSVAQQPIAAESESAEGELDFEIPQETENRDYKLPPSQLLNEIPLTDQSAEYESIEKNVDVLEQTFKSFGVNAKVVRASLGPSVTKFEIQPAVGVKVSKIVGLTDDLALALAAKDIRMEAPIPGKSLIGIEVPNNAVSTVSFRDIVEAQPNSADNILEVPLGRDVSGSVISADLAKMPHLLIAGSTGSGKSVCINGIITSILMKAKPHEVKLMMIDPKMVELNVYNGIPHLLTPVVTNPRKAAQALHKVVSEMEARYEKFAATGVRNITGFNDMVRQHNIQHGEDKPILPFIVVIVDELADLMMVASNEVEDAITRLAQMARAAGIHMILATQRPSVDVITGIIKANVPSRIAFAVSSGTDSRTIIDSNGAEKLLGRGDMLFLPMGENKPVRVQGAFISDSEVEEIVEFVTDQQGADYQEHMMPTEAPAGQTFAEELDELYEDAVALVVEQETASISMLQRRFRVGYNRAARIVDQMEANGVVGPPEGSKPRKVILESLPEVSEQPLQAVQENLDL